MPQRESDLAENLIDKMLSAEFEPEKYHDEYRERVLAMMDQRAKGQEITLAPPVPERRGICRCFFRSVKAEPRASSAATRDRYTRTGGQVGAEGGRLKRRLYFLSPGDFPCQPVLWE